MKIKGINPIERHVEKIVLLVVGVVFLGVVAMQFLVSPNQIELGGGKFANPGEEIYSELETQAERLEGQITDPSPSLPDVQRANLLETYEQGMASRPSVAPTLAAWLDRPSGLEEITGESVAQLIASGPVQPLEVPAPVEPVAAAQWNTLDPFGASEWPQLASAAASGNAPMDFPGVTVEASFPGTELLATLTQVEEGRRPIPRKLWQRGGLAVLDVEVERQRQTEDGGWTAAEPIDAGGTDALAQLPPDAGTEAVMALVRAASERPGAVLTPAYPPTISGDAWVPPSEATDRAARWENQAEADRIRAQIARIEEEMGGGATRTRPTRPTTSTTDPRDPGGRPTTAPARPTRPSGTDRQDEERRKRIERLEEQLRELGFEQDADPRQNRAAGQSRRDATSLLDTERVQMWAHDLTAEPGATYRYRLRAVVNNPLFGRESLLDPDDADQQALAEDKVLRGAWSAWTEPVAVPARTYLFVKGISGSGPLGGATRVTGEVFEMYYGYYRSGAFTLELGDAVRSSASLPDTLVFLDPSQLQPADADRLLQELARWDEARDRRPDQLPARPELPRGAASAPASIDLTFDAALVDVVQSMTQRRQGRLDTGDRPVVEAVFRRPDGSLMVREVGEDESPVYAQVAASAARGGRDPMSRITPEGQSLSVTDPGRDPRLSPDPSWDPRIPADPRDPRVPDDGP